MDLLMITIDEAPDHPVEPERLALALAAAELIDLLGAGAVDLDGGRIVPGRGAVPGDRFLEQAASSVTGSEPFELVGDWLWRRDRALADAYTGTLEPSGLAIRQRPPGHPFRRREITLTDSPGRRRATERRQSAEPVLSALTEAVGMPGAETHGPGAAVGRPVSTVLSALRGVLEEWEAQRRERIIAQAELDRAWERFE